MASRRAEPRPAAAGPAGGPHVLAVAAFACGLLWIYWIGSLLALVCGYLALVLIRRDGVAGAGLARAGIVLGWLGMAGLLAVVIVRPDLDNLVHAR